MKTYTQYLTFNTKEKAGMGQGDEEGSLSW